MIIMIQSESIRTSIIPLDIPQPIYLGPTFTAPDDLMDIILLGRAVRDRTPTLSSWDSDRGLTHWMVVRTPFGRDRY